MIFHDIISDLYFEEYGIGNELVLLHGWGTSGETFKYNIKTLSKDNHVIVIDLPGFGKSSLPCKPIDIDDFVTCIHNLINYLGLKNITLLGHSFGGKTAMFYALKYPVKRLVLVDSAGINNFSASIKAKILCYKIKKYFLKKTKNFEKLLELQNNKGSIDYKNALPIMKKTMANTLKKNLNTKAKLIKCETLIIWGENDTTTPLKDGKKLNKLIKNSGIVVIKNAKHFPHIERANYFNVIIKNYLEVSNG